MPIKDQKGWDEAYDAGQRKYGSIKNYLTRKHLSKLGFYDFINKEDTILDIGCGDGNVLLFLKNKGYSRLFGFDIREYQSPNPEIEIRKGNMLNIPYPESFANCLLCFNVMHHLLINREYERFILQCNNVLQKSGHVFFVEPQNNFIRKIMYIILAIPIINKIGVLRLQKKAVNEEKEEIQLFYKLNLPKLLDENGFHVLLWKSYLKSVIIHAQLK